MTLGLRSIPPQLQWPLCLRCAVFATHVLLLRIGLINCTSIFHQVEESTDIDEFGAKHWDKKWLKREDVGFPTEGRRSRRRSNSSSAELVARVGKMSTRPCRIAAQCNP